MTHKSPKAQNQKCCSSNGKGSKQRPMCVSKKVFKENWKKIFEKKEEK